VSWLFRILGISADNREPPVDALLFHHSWGKHNIHLGLLQNHLHGPGHRRLDPCLYLFLVPDLLGLFRLLPAFYLSPFSLCLIRNLQAQKITCQQPDVAGS
jgi:hypothetical protein